jgi:NAD(P)-dependent dehydrogenase (short-subunit alcohol dehydrogenase family)
MSGEKSLKALVVGGDSSLAVALVSKLQASNYRVWATSRRVTRPVDSVARFHLDLENQDSIQGLLASLGGERFDLIAVLIGAPSKAIETQNKYVETYFSNMIRLFVGLIPFLDEEVNSAFLHVSSRSSIYPSKDVLYSAVKGGLNSALRSMTLGVGENARLLSVAPGLILGSTMSNDMPAEVRASHKTRSKHELLNVDGFCAALVDLVGRSQNYKTGSIVEIGPRYE